VRGEIEVCAFVAEHDDLIAEALERCLYSKDKASTLRQRVLAVALYLRGNAEKHRQRAIERSVDDERGRS
jgi:hypothetical protein